MASSVAPAPSSTNILETLPTRPPTPPREAVREADTTIKSAVCRTLVCDPRLSLQTPPNANTPSSLLGTGSNSSSSRIRKKVEWSTQTDYRDAPQFNDILKPTRLSPLSTLSPGVSKPVKGILKPTLSPNPLTSSLGNELNASSSPLNIFEMLDSSIKQLAGSDRDSKLDAYMILSRALKASNNLPDRVALQDKMSLFMQFIQRDMSAKTSSGGLDSSLINHSLTLLATFLHFPAIASTLTTDFGIFVIDHSIRSFENEATPKDVVRHLMQVVAFQSFPAKVMTSDRVGRLVAAVRKLDNYLQGKSIVMSRLHIYKRLVKQSRTHMATHCDWLEDLFTDMLSTIKDIRSQAICLGTEAGFALRSEKLLLRKVTDILQRGTDGETYVEFYIKRLHDMIKEKQSCFAVPQIWSVVILFLRCPLDRWQYYSPWLTLVQSAFNLTDSLTKQEANFAWNRYIYLSVSDSKASPKSIAALCQPLLSQLRRKFSSKQHDEAIRLRKVVIGGVCNLYYYLFMPGSDKYSPDVIWDVTVQPVISQLINLDGKPEAIGDGVTQAARLLVNLLDVSTPRIWRQDRIMDLPPVTTEELPAFDATWTRKYCDKVLDCVGPILQQRFLDLAHKDSLISRLWHALVNSVTVASSKDIKVSEDTSKFVGCALGLLSKVIMDPTNKSHATAFNANFLNSVSNYVQLLVQPLGVLPFTEKRLSMTVPNTFEPVSPPSQRINRAEKPRGIIRMPLHHLFIMVSVIPANSVDDDTMVAQFHSMFEPFLKGKSAKIRVELAKELLHLIPRNAMSPTGPWLLAADCAKTVLETRPVTTTVDGPDYMLGPDYREFVSLLERGLTSHPGLGTSHWLALLKTVTTRITNNFGDAGCFLIVVEPLAKTLCDIVESSTELLSVLTLEAIIAIFSLAKVPQNRQLVEAARSKLWGTPIPLRKTGSFESQEALFKLGNTLLSYMYQNHEKLQADVVIMPIMETFDNFLQKHWFSCDLTAVTKLRTGLAMWIQDEQAILTTIDNSHLLNAVTTIWDHICSNISLKFGVEDMEIGSIEALMVAGFKSKHSAIVKRTILVWNYIVKDDEDLMCSESLKSIVSAVGSEAGVLLHSGSRAIDGFEARVSRSSGPGYDLNMPASSLTPLKHTDSPAVDFPPPGSSVRSMTRKRKLDITPDSTRNKPTKKSSTLKLRHDNSQIQFEPIVPSPPPQDESQHLTERQKEVRERQRQTAVLFSDVQTAPTAAVAATRVSVCIQGGEKCQGYIQPQETTPKQNKSFEDLVTSTPTPRRGEHLNMDDFNDPPSSPPVPRPCPLLSEIQCRARTGTSMETWEFSSPPGSPAESAQTENVELPSATSQDVLSPTRSLRSSKRQRKAAAKAQKRPVPLATSSKVEKKKKKKAAPEPEVQNTNLLEGVVTRSRRARGASRFEKVTLAKNTLTSRRRSSRQLKINTEVDDGQAVSEADLTAHVQADSNLSGIETIEKSDAEQSSTQTTTDKVVPLVGSHECIIVHTDSPSLSLGENIDALKDSLLPVVPCTTAEVAETKPSMKRKRGIKGGDVTDNTSNKRRSTMNELPGSPITGSAITGVNEIAGAALSRDVGNAVEKKIGTGTGLSTKWEQQEDKEEVEHTGISAMRQASTMDQGTAVDDVDAEVLLQLVAESQAASQQTRPQLKRITEKASNAPEEDFFLEAATSLERCLTRQESAAEDTVAKLHVIPASSGGENSESIIESLKHGLEQLRSASLTREKVYEMEDILMDMKRELFEAEKRGRAQRRPERSGKRKSRREH